MAVVTKYNIEKLINICDWAVNGSINLFESFKRDRKDKDLRYLYFLIAILSSLDRFLLAKYKEYGHWQEFFYLEFNAFYTPAVPGNDIASF